MPRRTELAQSLGIENEEVDTAVGQLLDCGAVLETPRHRLIHSTRFAKISRAVALQLSEFHRANPLRRGMSISDLRHGAAPRIGTHSFDEVLDLLTAQGQTTAGDGWVAQVGFEIRPTPRQQALLDRVVEAYRAAGLQPPTLAEVTSAVGAPPQAIEAMVQLGQDLGLLVQVGQDACFAVDAANHARDLVVRELEAAGSITAARFRDLASTSRKVAVELLEYMDQLGITARDGEVRVRATAG